MTNDIQAQPIRSPQDDNGAKPLQDAALPTFLLYRGADPAAVQQGHKVMFIVDDVAGWTTLAAAATPDTDVVLIRSGSAGLEAMADYLDGVAPGSVAAVHLVSHGAAGAVAIGTDRLDNATLASHADQIGRIGAALAEGGDIFLYACDAGAGAAGRLLVNGIATLARADVAASDNATGAAALGGDWTLETASDGARFDNAPLDVQAYAGTLALAQQTIPGVTPGGDMSTSVLNSADGNVYITITHGSNQDTTTTVYKWSGSGWSGVAEFNATQLGGYQQMRDRAPGAVDANGKIYLVTGGYDWNQEGNALTRADAKLAVYDGNAWSFETLEVGGPAPSVTSGVVMSTSNISVIAGKDGVVNISYHLTTEQQSNVFLTNASGAFVRTQSDVVSYFTFTDVAWTLRQVEGIGGHAFVLQQDDPNGQLIINDYLHGVANGQQTIVVGNQKLAAATTDANGSLQLVTSDDQSKLHFWENKASGWTDSVIPVTLRSASNQVTVISGVSAYDIGDGYGALVREDDGTLHMLIRETGNVRIIRTLTYHDGQWTEGSSQMGLLNNYDYTPLQLALDEQGQMLVVGPTNDWSHEAEYLVGAPIDFANVPPSLTQMGSINNMAEDTLGTITLDNLKAIGDEWDTDGTVTGFLVDSVQYGTLKIGLDAASATPWAVGTNDVIDATHKAFWIAAPNTAYTGWPMFRVKAIDDDGARSANPVQVTVYVSKVNDAPTLSTNASLYQINEDVATTSNNGTPISSLLSASGYADVDNNAAGGIVVVANTADPLTQGSWQFLGASGWSDVGTVSATQGLVLPANANLRFQPVAEYSGTPPGLVVHAIDNTMTGSPWSFGGTRITFDTTTDNDTSPVSAMSSTWSIIVRAVNDRPVVANLNSSDDQTVKATDAAVLVDRGGDARVTDVDNSHFAGGKLTLMVASGGKAGDVLGIQADAHIALSDGSAAGSTVSVDGVAIGTIGTVPSGIGLAVDLNADATPERVSVLMQHLTFDATGTVAGVRVLTVTVADGAGATSSLAATRITVTSNPTLAIASDKASLLAGQTAQLTLTFSDAPTGFDLDDLTVSGGTVGNLQATSDPLKFTATFTPTGDVQDLHAAISIDAGKFVNADGKDNLASTAPTQIGGDTLVPTVSIAAGTTTVKAGQTTTLTFTFSEAPAGFGESAVGVAGGQLTNLHATSQDGTTWEATFTPAADTATVAGQVQLAAGAYQDAAGNGGVASNVVAIGGDTERPTVTTNAFTVAGA
ncbi:Ig-like domain-containing protein, partial [uncultured Massilia sp.]|uniref:Ig-like domain-containing protein n=1 Tax=uncultured Massilia sp. TaxID=169973 RepID=UPI0025FD91A4